MPADPTPAPTPDAVEPRMQRIRDRLTMLDSYRFSNAESQYGDISWLLAQLAAARAALKPFAERAEFVADEFPEALDDEDVGNYVVITAGVLRRAREALAGKDVP